jgi:penicillin-binding protein 2
MRTTRMRDPNQEVAHFQMRLGAAGAAMLLGFGLLLARFVYLQVVEHNYYATRAEDNRISVVPIQPARGLILDRNGIVLARNYSAYTLEINPNKVDADKAIDALAKVITVEARDRRRFHRLLEETRGSDSIPIRTRLTDEEVARFAANRYRLPGIEIKARLFRDYPFQATASHAIGYIGRISDRDMEKLDQENLLAEYRGTDYIGKTGLEATYERELHGVTGSAEVEIDANGRAIRTLRSIPPVPGNNVELTIDIRLQQIAERAFGDFRGALVAIEPSTGGVLAFLSKPGYDPNLFVDGIDPQNWEALNNNPDRPLNNRALAGAYPPGSTIKPFMALAALQLGKRTPSFTINDPGYFTLPGVAHRWRDWKEGGHGYVDLHRAIVQSCDIYFYGVGNDLGIDNIHDFLSQFGFGDKTGVDIDGERTGTLPSTEWKMTRYRQKWFAGDTISVAIGQGYFTATPMQLAFAAAILANNGVVYRPHMARFVDDTKTGDKRPVLDQPLRTVSVDPRWLDAVKQAMVDVTRPGGTASQAGKDAAYSFAGKTGTAQVVGMKQNEKYDAKNVAERLRDHALFIAFAPAENPRIALGVLVENGEHGASTAAPIARTVLDYYLLGKIPQSMPDLQHDEESD